MESRRYKVVPSQQPPAVIVGGGQSFTAAQARLIGMAHARGDVKVVAINDAVYPCWFADMLYACDAAWWDHHGGVPGFSGLKVCLGNRQDPPRPGFLLPREERVLFVESSGTEGMDKDPQRLRTGGNSVYQALQLIVNLGADDVILAGVDMRGTHWFGEHPEGSMRRSPNFVTRCQQFGVLANVLDKRGIRVVNCSPGTALDVFPCGDLEAELRRVAHAKARTAAA